MAVGRWEEGSELSGASGHLVATEGPSAQWPRLRRAASTRRRKLCPDPWPGSPLAQVRAGGDGDRPAPARVWSRDAQGSLHSSHRSWGARVGAPPHSRFPLASCSPGNADMLEEKTGGSEGSPGPAVTPGDWVHLVSLRTEGGEQAARLAQRGFPESPPGSLQGWTKQRGSGGRFCLQAGRAAAPAPVCGTRRSAGALGGGQTTTAWT